MSCVGEYITLHCLHKAPFHQDMRWQGREDPPYLGREQMRTDIMYFSVCVSVCVCV